MNRTKTKIFINAATAASTAFLALAVTSDAEAATFHYSGPDDFWKKAELKLVKEEWTALEDIHWGRVRLDDFEIGNQIGLRDRITGTLIPGSLRLTSVEMLEPGFFGLEPGDPVYDEVSGGKVGLLMWYGEWTGGGLWPPGWEGRRGQHAGLFLQAWEGTDYEGLVAAEWLLDEGTVPQSVAEPTSVIALGALALGAVATKLRRRRS